MVVFNYSGEEINAKIVYYGPGLSGKTTNLEFIHSKMPTEVKGKMVSMKTRTDRTLFFDFLPLELGDISGYRTRFLLYTVPGQVYYNATRKLVLKGADAVVFVADSSRNKLEENMESLRNLEENLNEHGLTLDSIPWVIQYNKRDVPDAVSVAELDKQLNLLRVPTFDAVATKGEGVYETFQGIARLLYGELKKRLEENEGGQKKERVVEEGQKQSKEANIENIQMNQLPKEKQAQKPEQKTEQEFEVSFASGPSVNAQGGPPDPAGAARAADITHSRQVPEARRAPSALEKERAVKPKNAPGTGEAETETVSDAIDMALREVDSPLRARESSGPRPQPVQKQPSESSVPSEREAAEGGDVGIVPVGGTPKPGQTQVGTSESHNSEEGLESVVQSEEPPTDSNDSDEFQFEAIGGEEQEDRLGRIVELDEPTPSGEKGETERDEFITDPCRAIVGEESAGGHDTTDKEVRVSVDQSAVKSQSGEELTFVVPVVISRSQVRRTIPLKLVLEIHVTDDESKA